MALSLRHLSVVTAGFSTNCFETRLLQRHRACPSVGLDELWRMNEKPRGVKLYEVGALVAQISAMNRPFIRGKTARQIPTPTKTSAKVRTQSGKSMRKVMK